MYGNQYRPPSRKRPLGRGKRMGQGKPSKGAYQAGYDAAIRAMKSRKGATNAKPRTNNQYGEPNWGSYGDDFAQRGPLRVGWRV